MLIYSQIVSPRFSDTKGFCMKASIVEYVKRMYPEQYACVIKGGKLVGGWQNVANHCFVQAVAIEILGEALGLHHPDVWQLARVAACHDWAKRLQKKPDDFTSIEKERAPMLFQQASVYPDLMAALDPAFLLRVYEGKATFLELVQFLVDDMTMGEEIVPLDQRIDEASARNPNPAPEVQKQLGRPFWDAERQVGREVEAVVYALLKVRRQPYESIAKLINGKLNERFPI